jgi:hypothetical protein
MSSDRLNISDREVNAIVLGLMTADSIEMRQQYFSSVMSDFDPISVDDLPALAVLVGRILGSMIGVLDVIRAVPAFAPHVDLYLKQLALNGEADES